MPRKTGTVLGSQISVGSSCGANDELGKGLLPSGCMICRKRVLGTM